MSAARFSVAAMGVSERIHYEIFDRDKARYTGSKWSSESLALATCERLNNEHERDSLRTQLAEALDRVDRAQAAMLEEVNARIASEDKEHDAKTQLAEAVALLRRIYQYSADLPFSTSRADDEEVSQYAIDECVAGDARAFLARIDGADAAQSTYEGSSSAVTDHPGLSGYSLVKARRIDGKGGA